MQNFLEARMRSAGRYRHLKLGERLTMSWFAMSGVVHFCIEGVSCCIMMPMRALGWIKAVILHTGPTC